MANEPPRAAQTTEVPVLRENRVVIAGKTGSGKSTLGNILLQKRDVTRDEDASDNPDAGFCVGEGFVSETTTCSYKISENAWGRYMKVVDTPGLFDTTNDFVKTLKELTNVLSLSSPGPHAILFAIRIDVRFTQEEADAFCMFLELIQDKGKEFLILVFTWGETVARGTVEDRLQIAHESLQKIMNIVGDNYVVISKTNDKDRTKREVHSLLAKIDWVSKHGDAFYTNDEMKKMTEFMTEEVHKIMAERKLEWRDAEFMVKRGLALEKEKRFKDLKDKLLVITLVSPVFALLIGVASGVSAVGLTGATVAEILSAGSSAGLTAFVTSKLSELAAYLAGKREAQGKTCSIS